jgi:hypothetical protein
MLCRLPTFPALDPDNLFKMQDGEQDHGEQDIGEQQDAVPAPLFKDGDYEPQDALDPVPLNGESLDIGRYVLMPVGIPMIPLQ